MGKEREVNTGTDSWNVAGGYVDLKILKPLVLLDSYIRVAKFGSEDIMESINMPELLNARYRLQALRYMENELQIIIENTEFAIKKSETKNLGPVRDALKEAQEHLKNASEISTDTRSNTSTVNIKETEFEEALEKLREAKSKISTPLNNSGLIFPSSDEIDLDKIKDNLINGG